jgi:16S rRNA (uracil1498-N3)-methyltransferase
MPVFFIQSTQIKDQTIQITGDLAHHLRDVLRCRKGEVIELVDEQKTRYRVSLDQFDKRRVVAKILEKESSPEQPDLLITLVQAVLKGPKMDWVIQKATELGANVILPVVTERTIARPRKERELHQRERWQKIAIEAAQQCGRTDIADVKASVSLDALCEKPPEADLKLVLWEAERERSLKSVLTDLPPYESIALLVGPEGGFSPSEIEKVQKAGWTPVTLGRRILRAETASLAILAILQYEMSERA